MRDVCVHVGDFGIPIWRCGCCQKEAQGHPWRGRGVSQISCNPYVDTVRCDATVDFSDLTTLANLSGADGIGRTLTPRHDRGHWQVSVRGILRKGLVEGKQLTDFCVFSGDKLRR